MEPVPASVNQPLVNEPLVVALQDKRVQGVITSALSLTSTQCELLVTSAQKYLNPGNPEDARWMNDTRQRWEDLNGMIAEKAKIEEATEQGLAEQQRIAEELTILENDRKGVETREQDTQRTFEQQRATLLTEIEELRQEVNAAPVLSIQNPLTAESVAKLTYIGRIVAFFSGLGYPIHARSQMMIACAADRLNAVACAVVDSNKSLAQLVWVHVAVALVVTAVCHQANKAAKRRMDARQEIASLQARQDAQQQSHQEAVEAFQRTKAEIEATVQNRHDNLVTAQQAAAARENARREVEQRVQRVGRAINNESAQFQLQTLEVIKQMDPAQARVVGANAVKTALNCFVQAVQTNSSARLTNEEPTVRLHLAE